ncbi:hypothetical protein ACP4OV_008868 [Aristida adscensionis]
MYAVGKVGSLISRSVYTVSSPFHPFGGAVDIVVVQQQDGSFKSSPWYVRFGKFQGVLKTREKAISISVNGAEAGFHMYLGANGEAFFLRDPDPDSEEGDFVVSPASSGDEREAPVPEAQLRKSKSTSCDILAMEASVSDNKILERTGSKRSTILQRMFGRKSVKANAIAVDRVSSLERAEIAAELLDSRWSTNLPRGSRARSSNGEPSSSIATDAADGDQVETLKPVLPEHSIDTEKEMNSSCKGADSDSCSQHGSITNSVDRINSCLQTTGVKEEVVEIYTHEVSDSTDMSTAKQLVSESLSNDLGTDRSMNESVDNAQVESQHNFDDVASGEMHAKEVLSNGIFEIHAVETDTADGKSEVIAHFVPVDSDGASQSYTDTNSPTYGATYISTERHEISLIPSAQVGVQEKVIIISSSETVESSHALSNILADKVCDDADISLTGGVQDEECSRLSDTRIEQPLISEEKPLACHNDYSNKEDTLSLVGQDREAFAIEDSTSQILQANCEDMAISVETTANCHCTVSDHASSNKEDTNNLVVQDREALAIEDSSSHIPQPNGEDMGISVDTVASCHTAHTLACQHDVACSDASSVVEILNNMPENYQEDVSKDSTVHTKVCTGDFDVSDTQSITTGGGPSEGITQSINPPSEVEMEDSLGEVKDQTKINDDADSYTSASRVEIGFVPETITEPREQEELAVSLSEFTEEIQFQFNDGENFGDRMAMDDVTAKTTAVKKENDESSCDEERQEGGDIDPLNDLENCSDPLRPETSCISIPGSELHSDSNNMEVKSLPNIRSHIHDLERSDSFQLSCSLQSNGENNGVDPVNTRNSAFPEQEKEVTGNSEESSNPTELTSNAEPDDNRADDLKVDSFNPFTELSLCRHLLSEGMGEDAARIAFDSEKITLEKFRTMKQSLIRNNKLVVRISGRYFPWDIAAPYVLGMVAFSEEQVFEPQGMIKVERVEPSAGPGGSWRIWPFSFRRTTAINPVQPVCENIVEQPPSTLPKESEKERNRPRVKRMERKVRSLTPTSEELASLDLREGRNMVTFTFSTPMLGKQQVDCCIYLWQWNTRIVISDVDGTITKSDVLGQFMPLVGVDWSQNGVAHLFSAIKENGYQLLFLSARSISQAHVTRQFLFNLKQDGKALPDGPVVISPDGLFPSLYREVIRRAPHEFKISCLEAIRALFPPESNPNPFYAGFGNRDTDELSYLKVGIPMGKIFIINPRGEVAVNRRVDTKSYTSLHALVNGMFPPISLSPEQCTSDICTQAIARFYAADSGLEKVNKAKPIAGWF